MTLFGFNFDFAAVLLWLTAICGVIWLIDALFFARARRQRLAPGQETPREPLVVDYARSFFPVLFAVLLFRSFVYEPFRIPSGSMMPTLLVGDFILVNKFAYGLRLPAFNSKFVSIGEPKRGDVVVFRFPGYLCRDASGALARVGGDESGPPSLGPDDSCPVPAQPVGSQNWIKRVIGVPGDIVEVHDSQITINGKPVPDVEIGPFQGNPRRDEDRLLLSYGASVWRETLPARSGSPVVHEIARMPDRMPTNAIPNTLVPSLVPKDCYLVMGDDRENSLDSRWWGCVPEQNLAGKAFLIWMSWKGWGTGGVDFRRIGTVIH